MEMQKLEKKLDSALDALKQEQLSSEKARQRDALEHHRLEQLLEVPSHPTATFPRTHTDTHTIIHTLCSLEPL